MAFNIYACINTVTPEEKLCDRLHNARKIVFLNEVADLIVLSLLHNPKKNKHTKGEIVFYGNKCHNVRNFINHNP